VLSSTPARLLGLSTGLVSGLRAALTVVDPKTRTVTGVVFGDRHTLSSGVVT
jgi:dihydroorotase-like cyclic amidohydrolase